MVRMNNVEKQYKRIINTTQNKAFYFLFNFSYENEIPLLKITFLIFFHVFSTNQMPQALIFKNSNGRSNQSIIINALFYYFFSFIDCPYNTQYFIEYFQGDEKQFYFFSKQIIFCPHLAHSFQFTAGLLILPHFD